MHTTKDGTIYITDLDRCQPTDKLSHMRTPTTWKTWDYDTLEFTGTMLVAGKETKAPDVTYTLQLQGRYYLYVGMYCRGGYTSAEVKLTTDTCFTTIIHRNNNNFQSRIVDIFWKHDDLSGKDIVIRRGHQGEEAYIAYIKIVPMPDNQIHLLKSEEIKSQSKRLYAKIDPAFSFHPTDDIKQAIRKEIEPFRNTDFTRVYYEAAEGDITSYSGNIGRCVGDVLGNLQGFGVSQWSHSKNNWRVIQEQGIDALQIAIDYVHELGMDFHAMYRLNNGFVDMPPLEERHIDTGFAYLNPQWRCIDKDGKDMGRMSFAFQEVQDLAVSILKEVVSYNVDGICLMFNRQPPHVMYEEPLIQGFTQKYGVDPRNIDERDIRWLVYKAGILTDFMHNIKSAMEEISSLNGTDIPISVWVMASKYENLFFGIDLERWVKDGLVDTIIPDNSVTKEWGRSWDIADIDWLLEITKESKCEVVPGVTGSNPSPEDRRKHVIPLYKAGVQKLAFWDTNSINQTSVAWNNISKLGHLDELYEWERSGCPDMVPSQQVVTRLGDYNMAARERLSIMTDFTPIEPQN